VANNWVENQIRLVAIGPWKWLFAGSLRGGKRAAAVINADSFGARERASLLSLPARNPRTPTDSARQLYRRPVAASLAVGDSEN
jgi:hypothetical protein